MVAMPVPSQGAVLQGWFWIKNETHYTIMSHKTQETLLTKKKTDISKRYY